QNGKSSSNKNGFHEFPNYLVCNAPVLKANISLENDSAYVECHQITNNCSKSGNSFDTDDYSEVNVSHYHNETGLTLPLEFTQVREINKVYTIVYGVPFIFAAVGNLFVLFSVICQKPVGKTRVSLLLTKLCAADLIFLRAFGLYLSSNVVVCISVDRYYLIVHPLKSWAARVKRVKLSLVGAWIVSTAFATPQLFIYHVARHPEFPEFRQCVTKAFLKEGPNNELIYNVISVSALYIFPLLVVIYAYTRILLKLNRKSKEQRQANRNRDYEVYLDNATTSTLTNIFRSDFNRFVVDYPRKTRVILRCSENQTSSLSRADSSICWIGRELLRWMNGSRKFFFLVVVANSVVNPFIYGTVGRRQRRQDGIFQ
ncbi:Gonadotropin-releasing hormone II receptor, partial [Orchesella cincta]